MAGTDGWETGRTQSKLVIGGRPDPGCEARYVILEEPGEPIQVHYAGRLQPHYRRDCPHCAAGAEEPKAHWYMGAMELTGEPCILEMTARCYDAAAAAAIRQSTGLTLAGQFDAATIVKPVFRGLLVKIGRANYAKSKRILRCEQRVRTEVQWEFDTRRELARIWNVPVRPQIYREQA